MTTLLKLLTRREDKAEHIREMEDANKYDVSWILDPSQKRPRFHKSGGLGAMPYPHGSAHILYLFEYRNVGLVINLTKTKYDFDPLDKIPEKKKGQIEFLHVPFHDGEVPTVDQANQVADSVEKTLKRGKSVIIHCLMGLGRTGTMMACYLVKYKNMQPDEAIAFVREKRPGSIVNEDQENFVRKFKPI